MARTKVAERAIAARAAKAVRGGATPLEFLLKVMRDENVELWLRCMCAKAAAPYVHPRLAQIDHNVGTKTSIVITGGLPDDADGDQPIIDLARANGEDE